MRTFSTTYILSVKLFSSLTDNLSSEEDYGPNYKSRENGNEDDQRITVTFSKKLMNY